MLKKKTIIVGVSGGIAAYKTCTLVSRLKDLGADVWVAMTAEATKLVGPQTFRTLSGNPVILDLFSDELAGLPVPHISLAEKADLIVVAPATANIIGKMANGIADDALTTIVLASRAKKLIAPAMNANLWRNQIVKENVRKLDEHDFHFVGPAKGKLACGDSDIGRMSEPEEMIEKINELLKPNADLAGKRILITAGGTREAIDPVRYIGNRSSGKMGYALAEAAAARGAEVILISAPTSLVPPPEARHIGVVSAKDMYEAVMKHRHDQNIIIMAAAVADFRPKITFWQKVKKDRDGLQLELANTIDILKDLGNLKNGSKLVGFAVETENLEENAKDKLLKKNLDLIVANDTAAFEADSSQLKLIDRDGNVEDLPELPKKEAANRILDAVLRL
ncbi:MAG TPA: bifunctional phosphopantothenoylcysteine decarboxylase/phosphopantothenate--cysteine ligase CoaBC [Candidatus Omnitrophota bacterium]|nr:bifunctional phosphopantothenoylcysteine decarboxylase/phosphopantothenate--cysteine ligase CoaBC [Candidatus Omnitrophota bacterium]